MISIPEFSFTLAPYIVVVAEIEQARPAPRQTDWPYSPGTESELTTAVRCVEAAGADGEVEGFAFRFSSALSLASSCPALAAASIVLLPARGCCPVAGEHRHTRRGPGQSHGPITAPRTWNAMRKQAVSLAAGDDCRRRYLTAELSRTHWRSRPSPPLVRPRSHTAESSL